MEAAGTRLLTARQCWAVEWPLFEPHRPDTPVRSMMDRPDALAEMSDTALLVRYGNGDVGAANELTSRLAPRILTYASRILSDEAEAEDVTQEAMLRLWRVAPNWRQGEAQVSTWLYRVASNLCMDRLRKRGRSTPLDAVHEVQDDRPEVASDMIARDRKMALEAALVRLPERQRQAVVLRHIEGLSNPEIAAVMDIGVEAVESLTARGKRALVAWLRPEREQLGYNDD